MRATSSNQRWYSLFDGGQHQQVWGRYKWTLYIYQSECNPTRGMEAKVHYWKGEKKVVSGKSLTWTASLPCWLKSLKLLKSSGAFPFSLAFPSPPSYPPVKPDSRDSWTATEPPSPMHPIYKWVTIITTTTIIITILTRTSTLRAWLNPPFPFSLIQWHFNSRQTCRNVRRCYLVRSS
jgi:hypothetical protein